MHTVFPCTSCSAASVMSVLPEMPPWLCNLIYSVTGKLLDPHHPGPPRHSFDTLRALTWLRPLHRLTADCNIPIACDQPRLLRNVLQLLSGNVAH